MRDNELELQGESGSGRLEGETTPVRPMGSPGATDRHQFGRSEKQATPDKTSVSLREDERRQFTHRCRWATPILCFAHPWRRAL
jgi:hypothetical protein